MKNFFFVFFLFLSVSVFSWYDSEHMVIAKIAYDQLTPKAKEKTDELIHLLEDFFPTSGPFIEASVWADSATEHGVLGSSFHIQKRAYDPENRLTDKRKKQIFSKNEKNDVVFLIKQSIGTLKNKKALPFEKALMLRYLIHMAGDIHTPCHCGSLYSKEFPRSDFGGTKFMLKGEIKTLHGLWDSSLGKNSAKMLKRPLTEEGSKEIEELAKEVLSLYPKESCEELNDKEVSHWADESFEIVKKNVYEGIFSHTEPSQEYILKNRKIAYKRLALAGYRLANILNEVFAD